MNKVISVLLLAIGYIAFAEPTVTDVVAKQRYPWNGLVDITCKVSGIDELIANSQFVLSAVLPGSENVSKMSRFWVMRDGVKSSNLAADANGDYRLLWDAKAELGEVRYANMVVRVNIDRPMVQLWEGGPYWATTNIGAEKPGDYGYYFWWGDTVGYKRENGKWVASDGSNSNFSFNKNTPTWNMPNSILRSEGWITAEGVLAPKHDAAHVHWGGDWRMPTLQELNDLCYDKCDWEGTMLNGVDGFVVRGRGKYASNSIFLPCAGEGFDTSLIFSDAGNFYWSSEAYSGSTASWCLEIGSYMCGKHRSCGTPIRPVQGFTK
jgi:hypothetical protein